MIQNIDLDKTGKKLKKLLENARYDVKYIQKYLHLACPQSIYRWFRGEVLPTVDNLYALSILLGMHMEELIVPYEEMCLMEDDKRLFYYCKLFAKSV